MPALQRMARTLAGPRAIGWAILCSLVIGQSAADVRADGLSCPKSFAAAQGACSLPKGRSVLACRYPEGRCTCQWVSRCSGVPPPPPRSPAWRCEPPREDGCPEDAPAEGGRCKPADLACRYEAKETCGGAIYSCLAGTWQITHRFGPPPGRPSGPGRAGRDEDAERAAPRP